MGLRKQLIKPLEEDGEGALHVLPLYLMDHSGLSISTGDFQDRWDSGQVGFIYTTAERIKEMGLEGASTERLEKALCAEVAVYDQYLSGDVWYYTIEDDNGEVLDSCGGLYGHDYAEQEAKDAGHEINVGKFPLAALGRAVAADSMNGFVKIVADKKTDRVLGVHIVTPTAGDMIAEGALAIEMDATAEDLLTTIHVHPTFSEALMESAAVSRGEAVHVLRGYQPDCC